MVDVDFTPGGWSDLAALGTRSRFDVIHKLEGVEQAGVAGEQKIGEIAPHLLIYLLCTGHHHIAAIFDATISPALCRVFAITGFALIDLSRKAAFVNAAVKATGISTRVIVS